ncbi:phosphoethanolamine--lipid A transferase [Desulfuromonas sp. CSMB_57]|jgi:lipid A ethanolaminephosphotransferase|uniref:phosphoethanolamine transferase n=1 Tax=Desulfuromonas sp. CSMB_57 TaxID=2807629 RepID=UPI001CD372A4|nr:phosphoethanolamine--lipid A transferase [Desulfuromonas sp. CSMB_57]
MHPFLAGKFQRPSLSTSTVSFTAALFIALADNRLFWNLFISRLGLDSFENWTFLLAVATVFILLLNVLISLFAFRPVFKPFLITLLVLTAAISYFAATYGVVIDKSMIHNVLETDPNEASELLTWPLFRHMLWFGVLPAALVGLTRIRIRSGKREFLIRSGVVLGSLVILLGVGMAQYKKFVLFGRENLDLRVYLNPSYPIYSLQKVLCEKNFVLAQEPLHAVAPDAVKSQEGPRTVVVLALGETARARQFAFNGYERNTNPQLANRGIINFSQVQACGTSTAESLPCIFSALERKNFSREKAARQENLLDILQRVGVKVLWRDNNSGSKGIADRIAYEDLSRQTDAEFCSSDNCFDEILLQDLDRRLTETTGDMLIVLHMKGSHGPSYYKRTPAAFKIFSPECTQDNIQDCPQQTIVNAYDNTIVYTDQVLAKLIDLLRSQNFATAMLYVSDHGESLGENGLYLHGLPYALAPDEQKQVPMIFWASDSFVAQKSLNIAELNAHRAAFYSHDTIFHSIFGLFDIDSKIYRQDLDIFSACRTPG